MFGLLMNKGETPHPFDTQYSGGGGGVCGGGGRG